jgi:hypothetical protein
MRVGNLFGKLAVIDLVIFPADALLGHPCGAASFKNVERFAFESFGNPNLRLEIAEPFVLEMRKALNVREAADFLGGVPAGFGSPIQPERGTGFRREMPLDDFAHMGVELVLGGFDGGRVNDVRMHGGT